MTVIIVANPDKIVGDLALFYNIIKSFFGNIYHQVMEIHIFPILNSVLLKNETMINFSFIMEVNMHSYISSLFQHKIVQFHTSG